MHAQSLQHAVLLMFYVQQCSAIMLLACMHMQHVHVHLPCCPIPTYVPEDGWPVLPFIATCQPVLTAGGFDNHLHLGRDIGYTDRQHCTGGALWATASSIPHLYTAS